MVAIYNNAFVVLHKSIIVWCGQIYIHYSPADTMIERSVCVWEAEADGGGEKCVKILSIYFKSKWTHTHTHTHLFNTPRDVFILFSKRFIYVFAIKFHLKNDDLFFTESYIFLAFCSKWVALCCVTYFKWIRYFLLLYVCLCIEKHSQQHTRGA